MTEPVKQQGSISVDRLLAEFGKVNLQLRVAEEAIAGLQQQNSSLAKQLQEALQHNSVESVNDHAEPVSA